MIPQYSLRYFVEWNGPCLWANNDAARDRFGTGGVSLDDLRLSDTTKRRAAGLIEWHNQSLNQDYPPDPSLWRQNECNRFNNASKQLLQTIRDELGDDFDVIDQQPLLSEDPNLDEYLINSSPTNPDEVRQLVDAAIASISNTELAAKIKPLLRPAVRQTLQWEYGDHERFFAWRFADLGERDVWAAYCTGGHGALGNPWGLVFVDSDHFGSDFSWYSELVHLFEEWYA